ncbi:hypothetical protein J3R82DRAFT_9369 [Butyriboletus roseoflavus]|nr:hypothetical protein J3R82DRAFT_9369 [Butyriboletus roseoflavus]
MSTTSLPSSGYATPHSAASFPSTTSKAPSKPKPVNVFSDDGSFLERFQRTQQEEEDRRKAEEALVKKKQFADRFKNRGKRPPPPDSSPAVTSTDLGPNPIKKPKLDAVPQNSEYQTEVHAHAGRILKRTGTGFRPLIK